MGTSSIGAALEKVPSLPVRQRWARNDDRRTPRDFGHKIPICISPPSLLVFGVRPRPIRGSRVPPFPFILYWFYRVSGGFQEMDDSRDVETEWKK